MRPASIEDRELIWRWANDPESRAVSFDTSVIPWADHVAWFDRVLQDRERVLLIGLAPDPIGVVRFDVIQNEATVSINLAPAARGRGLGSRLVAEATAWFQQRFDLPVTAWIRSSNSRSAAAFERAGYQLVPYNKPDRLRYEYPGPEPGDA